MSVPVGAGYEVLLVARIGRTLVGARYRGKNNSEDDKAAGKGPVNISPGVVNEVVMTVEPLALQWDPTENTLSTGTEFDFFHEDNDEDAANNLPFAKKHRYVQVGLETGITAAAHTLAVTFRLPKFVPLILADIKNNPEDEWPYNLWKLTLAGDPTVPLWPRYIDDYFSPVGFTQEVGDSLMISDTDEDNTYYKV